MLIPDFRNLFFGSKKLFLTGFLRISFFFLHFPEEFSQERGFEEVAGIPVFSDFTGIFRRNSCGQEFLYLLRIPPEFRRIPVPAESCQAQASD